MSDSYQAIYDAVRSRISNGDIGSAVERGFREANLGHYVEQATTSIARAFEDQYRPCVLFRPKVYIDGDQWCALYGDDLQSGVAGFGVSPDKAMRDFDKNWYESLKGDN